MIVWPAKDPDEVVKKNTDWSVHPEWRAGDVIVSASFSLTTAAGMTISNSENDGDTTSTVTLSGGTEGLKGKILCEAITHDGQTLQQTATMLVSSR